MVRNMKGKRHLVVDLRPMRLTTTKKLINKLIKNQDVLCVVIVRYTKKKETNCLNKAQHVPPQENISYLNPRT
jgi:hypothetical protein